MHRIIVTFPSGDKGRVYENWNTGDAIVVKNCLVISDKLSELKFSTKQRAEAYISDLRFGLDEPDLDSFEFAATSVED